MNTFFVQRTIDVFKNGGVVIFPTDTAFGIGCRMDIYSSVERVYKIRKRPKEKAVLVLVDSLDMAQEYLEPIDTNVTRLLQTYWPGGLTAVLPCDTKKVPGVVRGNAHTLGVRVPDNSMIRSIIHGLKIPIIAPSANFAGGKTPFYLEEVDKKLQKQVDFILPGHCKLKQSSTVIDFSVSPWMILRQGAVKIKHE